MTQEGERDSHRLLDRFCSIDFNAVLTSPRQRARQTCELAGLGAVAQIDPDLAEWDYGDFEGITTAEIFERHPNWNIFRDGCPGGESPAQVSARGDRLIARLRARDGNVALFTHGHFGRVLAVRWIESPVLAAQHFLLSTASLSVLSHEHDRLDLPAIALWNDVSHKTPSLSARPLAPA